MARARAGAKDSKPAEGIANKTKGKAPEAAARESASGAEPKEERRTRDASDR